MKTVLVFAILLATAPSVAAKALGQSSFNVDRPIPFQRPRRQVNPGINVAKVRLEQLQSQLLRLDKEARQEIEGTRAEQLNLGPKGEFETTKEYEARKARAGELRPQIEEEVNRKTRARKDELNRRISDLLVMQFRLPVEAVLGVYDADTEIFPLVILPNSPQESLKVPRSEARELKENFTAAEKTGIFALHLDAENRARDYLLAATISYRGKSYQAASKEMSTERAMLMLYGNYSSANSRAKWRGAAAWYDTEAEYRALEAVPILTDAFSETNTNKFILVTGSVSEGNEGFGGCHTCGVKIGIAIFSQQDDIWRMEVGQKDIGAYGKWGVPPEVRLIKLGMDRYGVRFRWGDMGEGTEVGGLDFIDRVDGIFTNVLSILASEDTTGLTTPEDKVLYDSKIEYLSGDDPVYFDLRVTVSGTRGTKVGTKVVMRQFVEVKVYKFSDGVYKLAS